MLPENKKSLCKMLIALAWSDGWVDEEEMEVVEAVLDAFEADEESKVELREWAKTPRTLDDVDTEGLTESDLDLVVYQAAILTHIDGEQSPEEVELLAKFTKKLGLDNERAKSILKEANARAKAMMPE